VAFDAEPASRFELIGGDGSLTMEKKVLVDHAKPFGLDI
jgi:hypothetical protein